MTDPLMMGYVPDGHIIKGHVLKGYVLQVWQQKYSFKVIVKRI